jgi:hypothetical protein
MNNNNIINNKTKKIPIPVLNNNKKSVDDKLWLYFVEFSWNKKS